jgi:hypothetical protein
MEKGRQLSPTSLIRALIVFMRAEIGLINSPKVSSLNTHIEYWCQHMDFGDTNIHTTAQKKGHLAATLPSIFL